MPPLQTCKDGGSANSSKYSGTSEQKAAQPHGVGAAETADCHSTQNSPPSASNAGPGVSQKPASA
eukprot:2876438-Pleurochrysis_carterae.AAC.1